MSPEQLEAIAVADQAVGILLDARQQATILEQTLVILSADHGGHGFGHGSADPQDTIP